MPCSLVTGGAGFIGSHIAERLVQAGHTVVILDDLSGGFVENVPPGAELVQGSILDVGLVETLFRQRRFQRIYHLAAYAAEGLSHFIRRFNYTNNLVGSATLLNAAINHGVESFVFTSSIAVYGAAQTPMTEGLQPLPEDPYGIAKLAVEQDLKAAHELFGLDWVVFRPHNVYGERQNIGDRYRNVVGIFMNQLLRDEPMSIFGDGEQKRAFTHVDDVSEIIARAPEITAARNQVFNLGADTVVSVNDLAREVARSLGREFNVRHLPSRKEVRVAFADHEKARCALGAQARITLRDGLARMAAWVEQHGPRTSSVFDRVEIEKQLPASWAEAVKR